MDTKLKKSECIISWICFFLSISLFIGSILFALTKMNICVIPDAFQSDLQQTGEFRQIVGDSFDSIITALTKNAKLADCVNDDNKNMIFYSSLHNNVLTNTTYDLKSGNLPKGFNYLLTFDGEKVKVIKDGKNIDVYSQQDLWLAAATTLPGFDYPYNGTWESYNELKNCTVYIAVNSNIENSPTFSPLFQAKQYYEITRNQVFTVLGVILFSILLFVFYFLHRKSKALTDKKIALLTGKIWFEIKLIVLVIFVFILYMLPRCYNRRYNIFNDIQLPNTIDTVIAYILIFEAILLYGFIVINDIRYNKKIHRNNIIDFIVSRYHKYELKLPLQKQLSQRIWILAGAETILILFEFIIINHAAHGYAYEAFPSVYISALLFVFGLMVYVFYRFLRRCKHTVNDICLLSDQIDRIKSGDLSTPLVLPKDADIRAAADSLIMIQSGMHMAMEEQLKSERMKIELIANVSHDIKTPLTSIIGYIDLLQKEPDLPEYVQDYIKILANKSERMKTMVQDVFDVSKAASGNIDLNMESLDLAKLIQQTLADMNEEVEASGLRFKIGISESPVIIRADGKKLYRVFQNLIKNALQYSLPGSRVYFTLSVADGKALAEIKNTSSSEIDATFNYTERFARGDQSRSTEGSGLGLSIAKSFTEVCGGKFDIRINADLFCAAVEFPVEIQ